MATYYSDIATANGAGSMYDTPGCLIRQPFYLTISVAVASGDLFYLAPILKDSTLCGYQIDCPDLDTDASATGTCELGDATTTNLFVASSSQAIRNKVKFNSAADEDLAAAGNSDVIGSIHGTLPAIYTTASYLVLKLTGTVATARSSGTIKGWIDYVMQPKYRRPRL